MSYLYSDTQHVFATSVSGLNVYDLVSESLVAYCTVFSGCSSVTGNTNTVFFGTDSGLKYFSKTSITGTIYNVQVLDDIVNEYINFNLTSDNIEYLHSNDNYLAIVTISGVDVIKLGSQQYISSTVVSGTEKCFIMTNGELYYTVSGSNYWELNRVNTKCDWSLPDFQYITGSGCFLVGTTFNDIFVTENTSSVEDSNILYVATSLGAYVIDEGTQEYKTYFRGY